MNYLSRDKALLVQSSLKKGTSVRSVAKSLGLAINTVRKYGKLAGIEAYPYHKRYKEKKVTTSSTSLHLCSKSTKECLVCRFKKFCIDTGTRITLTGVIVSVTNKIEVKDFGTKDFYRYFKEKE